jgi:hypothetical protein
MKIGVIGPIDASSQTDVTGALRAAASHLLVDAEAERVIFLGEGRLLDAAIERWAAELGEAGEAAFLEQAAALAQSGDVDGIHRLLARDDVASRLGSVRKLPPPPARAIELVDDRIVLFVHDKSVLDEEDIANASVIVYGKSDEAIVKRFGKRAFAAPGPLSQGHVILIEPGAEGLMVGLYRIDGTPVAQETLGATQGKLTVA